MSIENRESRIEHRSKSGRLLLPTIALLGALALPGAVGAQELEARAYANTPVGVNFIALAYAYAAGNVFFDSALPIEDADGRTSIVAARYVRSIGLFGKPGKLKALVPFASGHWDGFIDGEFRTRDEPVSRTPGSGSTCSFPVPRRSSPPSSRLFVSVPSSA
jgi:hypothetical protein